MQNQNSVEQPSHQDNSFSNDVDPEAPTQIQYSNGDSENSAEIANKEHEGWYYF